MGSAVIDYFYLDLLKKVLRTGVDHSDRTGVGTRRIIGAQISHDMRGCFPILTTKQMTPRWNFYEALWMLRGISDVKWLQDKGITIWDEWADQSKFGREYGDLGPVYGKLWRESFGVDQIQMLIDAMLARSQSRRLIVTGWHPKLQAEVTLPPCHTLFQVSIDGDEFDTVVWCRSIDIFLGLPYDLALYGMIMEILGYATELTPRRLVMQIGDLHLYNNHAAVAIAQLERTPPVFKPRMNMVHHARGMDLINELEWTDVKFANYTPLGKLEADVAV